MTLNPAENAAFQDKTTTAIIGTLVRVWEDTPHQAIVPCEDENGSRFELVFEHGRKDLFMMAEDTMARNDEKATLTVTGHWNKRMWRKTKSPSGGWGHTWQLFVSAFSYTDTAGTLHTLGETPTVEKVA